MDWTIANIKIKEGINFFLPLGSCLKSVCVGGMPQLVKTANNLSYS